MPANLMWQVHGNYVLHPTRNLLGPAVWPTPSELAHKALLTMRFSAGPSLWGATRQLVVSLDLQGTRKGAITLPCQRGGALRNLHLLLRREQLPIQNDLPLLHKTLEPLQVRAGCEEGVRGR